ncbi:transcription factor [Sarracenia purpurea var. burkii]
MRPSNEALPPLPTNLANADVAPTKRRGGRTSRSAMKKNRAFVSHRARKFPEKQPRNNEKSLTPTPETGGPSTAVSCQEAPNNSAGGMSCHEEERESRSSRCSGTDNRKKELLVVNEGVVGESLWFPDTVGEAEEMVEQSQGVMMLGVEREGGAMKMGRSEDVDSGHEMQSSSSINSSCGVEWDLDWDDIVQGHELWGEEEKMLSLLWGSDNNGQREGGRSSTMATEQQEAIVAWLFS